MSRFRLRLFIGASLGLAVVLALFLIWRSAASFREVKDQGLKLAQKGELSKALPLLKASLDRAPDDGEILQALAKGYLAIGRKDEADEYLTRWLAQAPNEPEVLLLRVRLHRELGRFEKALPDLDRLLAVDPDNLAWRRQLVAVLYSAGRFPEAEKECRVCLETRSDDPDLRRNLAEIMKAEGKLDAAGAIFDGLLVESPHDGAAMMARALLFYYQDEPAKSVPLFRAVLKADPNRQRAGRYHLSLALNRLGQTEEADKLMEEVRRMQDAEVLIEDSAGQPDNLPLQMRTARAQFENNDLARALKVLRHVLSVDPDHAPAHALLAEVFDKQGQFDLAADHRRRAKGRP